ncbi:hypothetical protein GCM10009854_00080 [Saccharopolyspora halophila]|uniref:Carboxypeptidase regulatory-like domain-containing protein n=1 Tax=Saccharopolyspora halophila TaxID=405551 RepID=A0ABN3FFK5_9PSEU
MKQRMPTEIHRLRELFTTEDPVPEKVLAASYAAVAVRSESADPVPLQLVGDSAEEPVGTRSGAQPRVLTFAMPGRVLELDLMPITCGLYRVSGMVLARAGDAPPSGEIVLRRPDREYRGVLDEHGAFEVSDVPRGPVSVVFRPERAEPAVADWLVC